MHDFKKLEIWKKATKLAILVYQITDKFPKMEYIGTGEFNHISDKIDEIQKMLYKLTKTLKK